jgi:hypothetical protein
MITHRRPSRKNLPSRRRDPHKGYYGFDGVLDKYQRWMGTKKEDMDSHRLRRTRVGMDLAAIYRLLEKLFTEDNFYVRGFTPRAEDALYQKRPDLKAA